MRSLRPAHLAVAVVGPAAALAVSAAAAPGAAAPERTVEPAVEFTAQRVLQPIAVLPLRPPHRLRPPGPRGYAVARPRAASGLPLRSAPGGRVVARLGARTEFGTSTALAVVRRRGAWLGVPASALPNGRLGWVRRSEVALSANPVRLVLDRSRRRLTVVRGGRPERSLVMGVGRPGSETPLGRFAVTDKLPGGRFSSSYGCCILALSGRQPKLPPGWPGGDRLALHAGAASPVGAARSAGCVVGADADLRYLMRRVPVGTVLTVVR